MLRDSLRSCGILLDAARLFQTLRNYFRCCGILLALKRFPQLMYFCRRRDDSCLDAKLSDRSLLALGSVGNPGLMAVGCGALGNARLGTKIFARPLDLAGFQSQLDGKPRAISQAQSRGLRRMSSAKCSRSLCCAGHGTCQQLQRRNCSRRGWCHLR